MIEASHQYSRYRTPVLLNPACRNPCGLRLVLLVAGVLLATVVAADDSEVEADWPHAGGPNGDYVVTTPALASEWPEDGLKENWRRPLGFGYSGIAVVGDRLFTAYRTTDQPAGEEVLVALALGTGETLWERRADAPFAEYHKMEHGVGPHVTPTVVDGRVFFAGIYGDLVALDAESGELRWSKELIRDLGGTEGSRGYSSSPLALDGQLIVPLGGEGQGIVALDQRTGETVWSKGDFDRGYSSPKLIEVDGQRQIVLLNREEVMGLDPTSGERLWSHPHPVSFGLSISVPTYYPEDNLLFVSTAYNGGSRVLRLTQQGGETKVEELWAHKQMRIHIGNAIRVGDVAWGANGDFGAVPFTGVHIESGEIVHRTREIARAFHVLADGKLIALDEDGVLTLATPLQDGLTINAKAQLFTTRSWTPPTVVGRTLLARDQAEIVSLELP